MVMDCHKLNLRHLYIIPNKWGSDGVNDDDLRARICMCTQVSEGSKRSRYADVKHVIKLCQPNE